MDLPAPADKETWVVMSALKEFGIILSLENAVNVQVSVSLRVQIEPHIQNEDVIWGDFTNIQGASPGTQMVKNLPAIQETRA